jgi:hypothetical protein
MGEEMGYCGKGGLPFCGDAMAVHGHYVQNCFTNHYRVPTFSEMTGVFELFGEKVIDNTSEVSNFGNSS